MKIYQIDAFTNKVFQGNPAAVVPLENWLDDKVLQAIAAENNLAETAFTVPTDTGWELRWFTPLAEVALCGHATLAAAHVLIKHLKVESDELSFYTRKSGKLTVQRLENDFLAMSFPAIATDVSDNETAIFEALGARPESVRIGYYSPDEFDYVAIFNSEEAISSLTPDFSKFSQLNSRGVIATAPSNTFDFVSRYFAPGIGINEDPVTGSAHCLLTPYWSKILGKKTLHARQVSNRGGDLTCSIGSDNRINIAGQAVDYLIGDITL